ncbi:hypothetical protein A2U01_0085690, partial [Trifolium medium]|nr:hypothetical protein [Trifolium medium]
WRGGGNNTRDRPGEAVARILDIGLERRWQEYSTSAWRGGGIILGISLERRW